MTELVAAITRLFAWTPAWAMSLAILGLSAVAAMIAHAVAVAVVARLVRRRDEFWRSLVSRIAKPSRLAFLIAFLAMGAAFAPLSPGQAGLLRHSLLIAFIAFVGWSALTALDTGAKLYSRKFSIDETDNLIARKHLTQVRILQRAAETLIVLLTAALALMTIQGVRQWGVSLLAAGGAAGIIVGLALQPLLTNLIAGIQIAITQPIRIDDAVIVEGEWGRVEEINATYVVVKIWDWRRMVLPLSYFIQNPFQNWTRENASLIGTAMLYVDYAAPVAAMRAKLEEIARASALWDGQVINLAVTDLKERVMEVRCLISAPDAGKAFDLRCEVREKMTAFLQAEHPDALPRTRLDMPAAA
ncbi:mechanosensitive ion channel family protein [Caulobacter sp. NIBR2454]|uniref:mechanosensitive ion channel family protein n=1 Tax=Caulobacter sp. NIBR2454 TaxID=3015996 RepID=UPI0022B61D4E|nr:mechanosensitive ion channel domain-containing protein [Caulobacter sp. NIBR2454]